MTVFPRRRFLLAAAGIASGCSIPTGLIAAERNAPASTAKILETRIISRLSERYHGWPTLTRRADGELLVVCSGGRESHVCPFGRVELIRSRDDGQTWTFPRVLLDGPIDDRDAGIVETSQGSLLVTTFTSLAYEPLLPKAKNRSTWLAVHERISDAQRKQELGTWMIRSTDGGVSWSGRYDCRVNSPHGPIQLSDGRLLYAGKELWRGNRIGVCLSTDDGIHWSELIPIPTRPGDDANQYHELHAVETADGRILVHIRNHNSSHSREILQCESADGGRSWTVPHPIGVWGLPSFLTRLRDGRLLMSYGYRRAPFGNRARLSTDHGRTWSESVAISEDGVGGDLGYPSTVELGDGTLLTVWYERMKDSPHAVLRQARWQLV